jgi:hypothetical protein
MSDNPILNKVDALLKKHRGGDGAADAEPGDASGLVSGDAQGSATAAPAGSPPPDAWLPVLTQVITRGEPPVVAAPARAAAPVSVAASSAVNDALAAQLLGELAPRLSEAMEKIVRDALAEKLKTPRDPSGG